MERETARERKRERDLGGVVCVHKYICTCTCKYTYIWRERQREKGKKRDLGGVAMGAGIITHEHFVGVEAAGVTGHAVLAVVSWIALAICVYERDECACERK